MNPGVFEVKRYRGEATRFAARDQLRNYVDRAKAYNTALVFDRSTELSTWTHGYTGNGIVWCAWGDRNTLEFSGNVYFAPRADPATPQEVRDECQPEDDDEEVNVPECGALCAVEIRPRTQTTDAEDCVGYYEVRVKRDPARQTTLQMVYGDGSVPERVLVGAGSGAATFYFSHVFPPGVATYRQRATVVETGAFMESVTEHPDYKINSASSANFVGYMYVRGANTGTETVRAEGLDNWNGPQLMRQTITGPTNGSVVSSDKGGATDGGNWFKVKTAGIDTNLRYLRAGTYDVNVQNGSSTADYGYDNHTTWNDQGGDCMTWTIGTNTVKVGQVTYLAGTDGVIDSAVDINGANITPDAAGYYKFTLPSGMNPTNGGVSEQAVCISSLGSVNGNQAPLEILNVL